MMRVKICINASGFVGRTSMLKNLNQFSASLISIEKRSPKKKWKMVARRITKAKPSDFKPRVEKLKEWYRHKEQQLEKMITGEIASHSISSDDIFVLVFLGLVLEKLPIRSNNLLF